MISPHPGRFVSANVGTEVRQAGCIVFYGDQVVLRRTPDGHWVFPKGHLEPGETEAAAAAREVAEEVGVEVQIAKEVGEIAFSHRGEDRRVLFFLAHVRRELPSWPHHLGHDAFLVPPGRVRALLSFANSRELWDLAHSTEKEQPE